MTERRQNQMDDFMRLEEKVDTVIAEVDVLSKKLFEDHSSHHEYIKKAMEREARKESLHQAIIEKTLVALLWSGIVGLAGLLYNTFMAHWK